MTISIEQFKYIPIDTIVNISKPMLWAGNHWYYNMVEYLGIGYNCPMAFKCSSSVGGASFVVLTDLYGFPINNLEKSPTSRIVNIDAFECISSHIVVQELNGRWVVCNHGKPTTLENAKNQTKANGFYYDISKLKENNDGQSN